MDLKSKKIDNKSNNYISIENIKEEEYLYIVDTKNILKIDKSKNIYEDLGKFFGLQLDTSEEDLINQSTNSSMTNSVGNANLETNGQKLFQILIEKLYPKCNLDSFIISKKLSTQYFKKYSIDNNKLEDCVNYIYNEKHKITYSSTVNLDLTTIRNLGYILMMSYHKFNEFKINERKAMKPNIKKTLKDGQNVIQDFFNYCSKKKRIAPEHYKKTVFWENNSTNYYLPAIFIFLLNSFEKIEKLNINFDSINDMLTCDDVDLLAIIVNNIQYIFPNVNHAKINIIHNKLQCYIFSKYFEEYQNALNLSYSDLKKRLFKLDFIYDKKWDFKTEFLNEELRQKYQEEFIKNKDKNNLPNKNFPLNKSKTNDLREDITQMRNETKLNVNFTSRITGFFHDIKSNLQQRFSVQPGEGSYGKFYANSPLNEIEEEDIYEENRQNEEFGKNNPNVIYNKIDIGNDYENTLKGILLVINALNRISNLCILDLVFNDSYTNNMINFFENEVFDQENKALNMPLLKDFHLLDIMFNKFMKLNTMNIEFNSLDSFSFKKVLEAINSNASSFLSLNISFFSSDITYFPQSLYKLNNSKNLKTQNWREGIELKILDNLLENFATNLQVLFNLIRIKKMQILGLNFDIPDIMENKEKYNLVIVKFVLNVLLYMSKKETVIQKLVILAPKIKMNNDFYPFINEVLGNINNNNINKIIKELSFQMQLYKVVNIKNIINESLILLNIGNCDIYTFKELVQYLTSFKFCFYSSLSTIQISLIKTIRIISMEMYKLFFKLFNIKIKQLKEINLYTNIIISLKEYFYLLNIFHNNWISSCTFTFNKKSEEIYKSSKCEEKKNKIKFFVPGCLEESLLSPDEQVIKKKIDDKNIYKNDEVYWYLKYIFKIKYSCVDNNRKQRNESLSKFLANNILSYIHFQKYVKISHILEQKESKEEYY